ncbi:MAG: ATP-dependent DNA helicase [Ilumatobacteraceae bacterium]|jgi:ATP-dependent DNA helicase DinG|nr:ATP-dependent DNA helicase [Ilumatobacteraceae bacterium]
MSRAGNEAIEALRRVTATFEGSEERQGQIDMSHAIAESLASGRNAIIQAGTGTGKSLGYLVPAILNGKKTVVATATKALQDQLNRNDLPLLQKHLGVDFSWAVVKGRSNYICLQRVRERKDTSGQLEFEETTDRVAKEIDTLVDWAKKTSTGDFEELARMPSEKARQAVSVAVDECPGRNKCPVGADCFAERARDAALAADVVVVNIHLYGTHIASGGNILPEHDVVIFDEAHQIEAVLSDTVGTMLSNGRITSFASSVRKVMADPTLTNSLEEFGLRFSGTISPFAGQRLPSPLPSNILETLSLVRIEVNTIISALRDVKTDNEATQQRIYRAQTQGARLVESLDLALGTFTGYVAYVEGSPERPSLRLSPLHVGDVLQKNVWDSHVAILTSATVPSAMPERVGLPLEGTEVLTVDSPFDYERNSRLYCSPNFPDRNSPQFTPFVHDELESLITAAGGRTLALFTSNKALNEATEALRQRVPFPILSPSDYSRQRIIEMFMEDEHACIFASQSFFQGVDLPGRTLSLVILDKLPFPRPDDPLLEARREAVGRDKAFTLIDLPIAATSLAQAAGRLIRTADDMGVVAVLDNRLATKNYWRTLIAALPPMTRTRERAEVEQFLRDITAKK